MHRSTRDYDQVTLFYLERITAFDCFASPLTGRNFIGFGQLAAERKRRLAIEYVINVVGIIVKLVEVVFAFFIMKKGNAHLRTLRSNNIAILVPFLLLEFFRDLVDLRVRLDVKRS